MRRLLQPILATPTAVVLLVALAAWGGVFALAHLPVGLFPGLDVPVVNVVSHHPGAAADEVEYLVTRPIEDRIRAIPGVRRVSSTSIEGVSQVTAEFEWGTALTDARQLVQTGVSAAEPALPPGVRPRLENIGATLQEVATYVVYGGAGLTDLRAAVRMDLAGRLMAVDGVARVEVVGGDEPAFIVRVRPEALARERLSLSNVTAALADHNRVAAAGYIERGSREYPIHADSRLRTLEDIESVPVVADGERSILVRDIATVRAGVAPRHFTVHGDGVPGVAFMVFKQPAASTLGVVRGVDRELAELESLLPTGARIRKTYDQADIIAEARDSLFHDLLFGSLLAAGVLYFFLGTVRATCAVAAAIPIALLAALAAMQALGQTLNVITLSALTLAVGMVVDDAIVVAENILRHLQPGRDRVSAVLAGTSEIAGADSAGTFTTIAAFAPLLFMGGIAGLFVRPFGLVVSAALLASLVVSLTFVPVMFGRAAKPARRPAAGSRVLVALDRGLRRALRFTFAHRTTTVGVSVLSLGLAGLAAWLGPVRVLPPIDEGAILIEYVMPPGTSLPESDRIGGILEQAALSLKDVASVYRRTGSPDAGYQVEGVNRGELTIKLKPRAVRTRTLAEVMDSLRRTYAAIPGVAFLYHQPTQEKMDESLSGLPAMFGVTLYGPDTATLVALAAQAEPVMAADDHITHVVNNPRIAGPRIVVRPVPAELARCGLAPGDVFQTIEAARSGIPATTIINQRRPIQVRVACGELEDDALDALKDLAIAIPSGETVPLRQIADIHVAHLPATVTRLNGQRELTLLADVSGSIPAAVARLRENFAALSLPDGYSIAFTGQYPVIMRTVRDFVLIGLAAAILIYLIMAMQFRSYRQALYVLAVIPFALVGAIVLLAVTRAGLDVSVGMGALTLVGISVNNAIVLLDCANRRMAAGDSPAAAFQTAASIRLRPILMTALTTIFALLPIALNPAVGSRIFQPFAVTVIGGLLSATVATLLLVPTLASGLHRPRSQKMPA